MSAAASSVPLRVRSVIERTEAYTGARYTRAQMIAMTQDVADRATLVEIVNTLLAERGIAMNTNTNTNSTFNLNQNADAVQIAIRMIAATSGRSYQQGALRKIAAAKVVANTPRLRISKKLDDMAGVAMAKLIESGSLRMTANGQVAFRLLSDERANVISPELDDLQQRTLAKIAERTEREKKERQADAQPEPQQPKPEPKPEGQPSGLRAGERPTHPGPSQEIWDLAVTMQERGHDRKAIRQEAENRGYNRGTVQNVLGWYFWKH